ncbi:hypothetical protein HMPREF3156_02157 [Neisseria sp. HMSC06F02]|nr:hypothetical protein HMPREF3156_02157 [Neisseria sp. HMSC06F02]
MKFTLNFQVCQEGDMIFLCCFCICNISKNLNYLKLYAIKLIFI